MYISTFEILVGHQGLCWLKIETKKTIPLEFENCAKMKNEMKKRFGLMLFSFVFFLLFPPSGKRDSRRCCLSVSLKGWLHFLFLR